jgi:3'-5' exoribonuclease
LDKKGPHTVKEIKNIGPGQQIWGKFLVLDKTPKKTKDGKSMVYLKIGDLSGEIDAVVWDNCAIAGSTGVGTVIGLLGDTGLFNNHIQITAKRIKTLEDDPLPYLKKPPISMEELTNRFNELLQSVKDPYLHKLLDRIFTPEMKEKFFRAPAAKKIHHNYSGGLLEHTVAVAGLCLQASSLYQGLNPDLLVVGAILHDIGKVDEYTIKVTPEYTVAGRMMGHIVIGEELVGARIKELRANGEDFPEELEWILKHMILSHHGMLEYGSPVKPLLPEALLLHMADNLDAKMFIFNNKIAEDEGEDQFFTNYDGFFDQHFFKYRYTNAAKDD